MFNFLDFNKCKSITWSFSKSNFIANDISINLYPTSIFIIISYHKENSIKYGFKPQIIHWLIEKIKLKPKPIHESDIDLNKRPKSIRNYEKHVLKSKRKSSTCLLITKVSIAISTQPKKYSFQCLKQQLSFTTKSLFLKPMVWLQGAIKSWKDNGNWTTWRWRLPKFTIQWKFHLNEWKRTKIQTMLA